MTIFERIAAGELPCHLLHQDATTFAFLDNGPIVPGHALLIPRVPVVTLDGLDPETGAALGSVLPRLCAALRAVTGADGLNVVLNSGEAAGQEVPHLHFHLIPRHAGDGASGGPMRRWQAGVLEHAEAARFSAAVREHLAVGE